MNIEQVKVNNEQYQSYMNKFDYLDFKPSIIYNDYIKRIIDFLVAIPLTLILSPLILLVAILIKKD